MNPPSEEPWSDSRGAGRASVILQMFCVDGRKAAMFTSGVHTPGGTELADQVGIALFR